MKVIQTRFFIETANSNSPIQDRTSLLVWLLSVLYWKRFGYDPILYTDPITKEFFDTIGLSQLYSDIVLMDNEDINTKVFWASAKILSAKKFIQDHPDEEFMISDLDFIPLADPATFAGSKNDLVTFYHEYAKAYDDPSVIGINPNYVIPDFYTGKIDPINTCLLYIQKPNIEIFDKYLDIEIDFMNYHYEFIDGDSSNKLMTFLEQRLFAEYIHANNINVVYTCPKNKSIFNVNGIHTGVYKSFEKIEYWKWISWYLKMIHDEFPEWYSKIINLEMYADIKEIIETREGVYTNKRNEETKISNFSWDTLEYPRAFEDIYDPAWRD